MDCESPCWNLALSLPGLALQATSFALPQAWLLNLYVLRLGVRASLLPSTLAILSDLPKWIRKTIVRIQVTACRSLHHVLSAHSERFGLLI